MKKDAFSIIFFQYKQTKNQNKNPTTTTIAV